MSVRFVLAPQAALDLVEIWRYIKEQASLTIVSAAFPLHSSVASFGVSLGYADGQLYSRSGHVISGWRYRD